MGTWAIIKDKKVVNTILWSGPEESPMDFGENVAYIEFDDKNPAGIGYIFDGEKFIAPPLTKEEIAAKSDQEKYNKIAMKNVLMAEASNKISVLQDAVDLEMATDAEYEVLPLWKKYRVLLSRVDTEKSEEIKWPNKP